MPFICVQVQWYIYTKFKKDWIRHWKPELWIRQKQPFIGNGPVACHVTATTDMHVTVETLLEAVFSVWSVPSLYNVDQLPLPVKVMLRLTVSQSVLVSGTHLRPMDEFLLLSDICGFVGVGCPLWQGDGSIFYNWPAQSSSGPSPAGLMTMLYCIRFEALLACSHSGENLHPESQLRSW
jgi:hypothetical protein